MSYRRAVFVGVFVLVASSFAAGQNSAPASGAQSPSADGPPVLLVKFIGNLNTKSAKAGDPIAAKAVNGLKLKDMEIPKGSKLTGNVAAVQSKDAGNGTSSLAVKFDRVELKSGTVLRVQGLIVAIGKLSNSDGLGANSVLSRGGAGSTPGLDPGVEVGHAGNRDDIPAGSTLDGVALGTRLDADGATELRGVKREIRFDSDVTMKVALYRGTP